MTTDTQHIRLYLFECGVIHVPLRNMNLGEGANGEMITNPTPWYLVTHPRGNVVIDGGNAPEVAVDYRKHWGAITEVSTPEMTPEEAVLPAMKRAGFEPASVRWIVQTHLHLDHTGALAMIEQFPNAEVLVTRREYAWAHAPASYAALGYCPADYVKPGIPWVLLEQREDGYDLFGDGTLRCWWTPGTHPATCRSRSTCRAALRSCSPPTPPTRSITCTSASCRRSTSRSTTRSTRYAGCAGWAGVRRRRSWPATIRSSGRR